MLKKVISGASVIENVKNKSCLDRNKGSHNSLYYK